MTDPTDDMPDGTLPDTPDLLAAEYVLGVMDTAARAAFERQMRDDPALAARVVEWEARFAAMAEAEVAPVAPPPRVEAALMRRLFPDAAGRAPSIWQRLGLWQALAALGAATSVALGVILYTQMPVQLPPTAPPFAARLAPTGGADAFLAVYDPDAATLSIRRADGTPRPGRAQEVWLIAGEAAPVSLGLLDAEGRASIAVPADLQAMLPGAILAVSDEPPGGSPTGAPTGDVLALGEVTAL